MSTTTYKITVTPKIDLEIELDQYGLTERELLKKVREAFKARLHDAGCSFGESPADLFTIEAEHYKVPKSLQLRPEGPIFLTPGSYDGPTATIDGLDFIVSPVFVVRKGVNLSAVRLRQDLVVTPDARGDDIGELLNTKGFWSGRLVLVKEQMPWVRILASYCTAKRLDIRGVKPSSGGKPYGSGGASRREGGALLLRDERGPVLLLAPCINHANHWPPAPTDTVVGLVLVDGKVEEMSPQRPHKKPWVKSIPSLLHDGGSILVNVAKGETAYLCEYWGGGKGSHGVSIQAGNNRVVWTYWLRDQSECLRVIKEVNDA